MRGVGRPRKRLDFGDSSRRWQHSFARKPHDLDRRENREFEMSDEMDVERSVGDFHVDVALDARENAGDFPSMSPDSSSRPLGEGARASLDDVASRESEEIVAQRGGRTISVSRLLLEATEDDGLEIRRDPPMESTRRHGLVVEDPLDRLASSASLETGLRVNAS
jgi:hypothetical protein